jgi:hypothetical protein
LYDTSNEEPTPDDLLGVLGIFPPLCDRKIGQRFKKCRTDPPVPKGMMGKGGKGGRRRNLLVTEDDISNELLMAFNLLSSEDKKRLMIAIEHDDNAMVDTILDGTSSSSSTTRQLTMDDATNPTPDDLLGVLGIFPPLCDRKIGQRFKKCRTDPPVPKGMMGKGGKGERRRTLFVAEDDVTNELLVAYNALSSDDKKRLLIAIEMDDEEAMRTIFDEK